MGERRGIERAKELIEELGMQPHVEGGYFVEVYKSPLTVKAEIGERRAVTAIYYLLVNEGRNSRSRLHRVMSDELWFHCEGDPLELFWVEEMDEMDKRADEKVDERMDDRKENRDGSDGDDGDKDRGKVRRVVLGERCFAVVPACCWQAARTLGEYTLVSCVVAPGFTYEDFELFEDTLKYPELRDFV